MKTRWTDRILLRGRDPLTPVPLIRHERLRIATVFTILIFSIGMGLVFHSFQQQDIERCRDRNEQAATSGRALHLFAEAAETDGNPHQAAVWRLYIKNTSSVPAPKC